jgi:uncharacterized membrane protein YdbT with pleckstrin-like domain
MRTKLKVDEKVLLEVQKHPYVFLKPIFYIFVLSIFFASTLRTEDMEALSFILMLLIVGYSIRLIWVILDRKTNIWVVTNQRVIDEFGILSKNSKETPLDKINNLSYRQSLLGRLFDFGHIQIQSAAELGDSIYRFVERPQILKDSITKQQELYKQEKINQQAKKMAEVLSDKPNSSGNGITEELTKLHELKEKGIITQDDFENRKQKLLDS